MTEPTVTYLDPDGLIDLIQRDRGDVLPLVGAGLAAGAGAPSVWTLTRELARRSGVAWDPDESTLLKVTRLATEAIGERAVQQHVADITTGLRLKPTPSLIAVCGAQLGRVLTTNYDDALERAAIERGLTPVTLLPRDPEILKPPASGQLHIVHLHGIPAEPESLILPGQTMLALDDDEVFRQFVQASMAPWTVVYFGFSLARSEVHLRHSVHWLGDKVPNSGRHYLLMPQDELKARGEDVDELETFGNVKLVPYLKDRAHTEVERVALALAPRVGSAGENRDRVTYVYPLLTRVEANEDEESVQTRLRSLQLGIRVPEDTLQPGALLGEARSLIVAGPGMGKSTLLERLPGLKPDRYYALAGLRQFQPAAPGEPPESAVLRLLHAPDREPLAAEWLDDSALVARLDGFDEVPEHLRESAAHAIADAISRWPAPTWIVTSRPGPAAAIASHAEFAVYRIPALRAWAETYLRARSVPPQRIERALLDGYGLGDLLTIPLFAERLADRLLDYRGGEVSPLELLVEEQFAACRREARRQGQSGEDLSLWMRTVAAALELRGLVAALTEAVAEIPGPPGLLGREARRRLADASLLSDTPGVVAFPAKTLQEGLAAHAILACPDPVAALDQVAVAEVDGTAYLRDDIDFTLDLVFEHADRVTRARLRDLDELRWARTVATRGDTEDAADAYDVLVRWHADRGRSFAAGFSDGLRTPIGALGEIVRRWPDVVAAHRAELEEHLEDASPAARSRALTVLGLLASVTAQTDPAWLGGRVLDPSPAVAAQAAALAGRLRARSSEAALIKQLEHRDDRVRHAALSSLIEIVDPERLAEVMHRNGASVRPVAERLLERLDVDTGLAVIAAVSTRDQLSGWLLERLIATAREDAWTPQRVARLAQILDDATAIDIDPALVAEIFERHSAAAIAAVRVRDILGGPYAGREVLRAFDRLDPALLAGAAQARLREAIQRARDEEAKAEAHRRPDPREDLAEAVRKHGADVGPRGFGWPLTARELTGIDRAVLLELVERWWPAGRIDAQDGEGWFPQETDAALSIGAAIVAPLEPHRWYALLRAHLASRSIDHALHSDAVTAWLHDTRPADADARLRACIAAADGPSLRKLVVVSGAGHPANEFTGAIIARLLDLDPEAPGWLSVASLVSDRGDRAAVRRLLELPLSAASRRSLLETLAADGDAAAQEAVLDAYVTLLEEGARPERPHWFDPPRVSAEVLGRLAEAAIRHDAGSFRDFALGTLVSRDDAPALATLRWLADQHPGPRVGLSESVERAARSIATKLVLARLPGDLAELAETVHRNCGLPVDRS